MLSAAQTLGSNIKKRQARLEGRTWPRTLAGGLDESQDRRRAHRATSAFRFYVARRNGGGGVRHFTGRLTAPGYRPGFWLRNFAAS